MFARFNVATTVFIQVVSNIIFQFSYIITAFMFDWSCIGITNIYPIIIPKQLQGEEHQE